MHSCLCVEESFIVVSKYQLFPCAGGEQFCRIGGHSDRICSLEVAWILEDIAIIKDSFNFISYSSIPLRCNRAALTLTNAAKEKEEVIV